MKMRKTLSILSAMLMTAGMVSCGKEKSSNAVPPVAEITTTGGQTDAAATSTENITPTDKSSTETQLKSTTESSETTTVTAAAARLSDQELESYARRYYGVRTNYSPEFVEIRQKDDSTVVIRLFDRADDHEIACEQYTVNPETGEGQDSKGKDVSITNNSLEMWYPEDWAYGSSNGIFARILYLGKMKKDDELNQDTLQTLIDSSAGTREYVNHYSYINNIPNQYMFSTDGGEQAFMIIPADKEAQIKLDNASQKSAETSSSKTFYRTYSGQPIILRCNKGGKSDVTVQITDNAGEHEIFSPTVKNKFQTDCGVQGIEDLAYAFT